MDISGSDIILGCIFLFIGLFLGQINIKLWFERELHWICSKKYKYNDNTFYFYIDRETSYSFSINKKIKDLEKDIEINKGREDIVNLLKIINNRTIKNVKIGKWTKKIILFLDNGEKVQEIYH